MFGPVVLEIVCDIFTNKTSNEVTIKNISKAPWSLIHTLGKYKTETEGAAVAVVGH